MLEERILEAAILDDLVEVESLLNQMTINELVSLERAAQEIVDRAANTIHIKRGIKA